MSADQFPSHWQLLPLSEAVDALIDYRGKTPRKTNHGVPLVTAKIVKGGTILPATEYIAEEDYDSWMVRGLPKAGDVVVTTEAPLGEVAQLANENVALAQRIVTLRGAEGLLQNDYLRYVMQGAYIQGQLESRATGSTVKGIKQSELRKIILPIPPEHEQIKIAGHLRALDDKIQLNHQINQTLEQMAQAIFKSWFVDFDPVKAKIAALEAGGSEEETLLAAMQAISGKSEAELTRLQAEQPEQYAELRATAELFPSAMQDSELGEIPEGWAARPFGELLEKTIGGDWGKEEPDEKHTEMVKILRGTDLPNIYAGDDGKVPTRYVEPKKLKTRSLKPGDIVIEVSGGSKGQPTGRSLFLTSRLLKRLGTCEPASFCRLFRPKDQETGLLLGLHLQHIYAEGKTWLYQNQSTGISNFQTKIFLEHELVATPPETVMHVFYKRVIPLINRIHGDESAVLAALRDSLLPKLLSGELSITRNLSETASESLTAEQEAT